MAAIAVLSLLSLITLRSAGVASSFLMLLSAVAMLSLETLRMGQNKIFATIVEKMSRRRNSKKKKEVTAYVRETAALEDLSKVTRLALLGRAALYDGVFRVEEACVFAKGEKLERLDTDSDIGKRIFTCIHTYV